MKPHELIEKLDDARIVEAIAAAERATSGEIRVCVSHRRRDDALAAARRRFFKLGMERTRQRNAVLVFLVPRTRQFAVWGDIGVHARCGDDFWKTIVAEMTPLLREGRFTDAVVLAVGKAGEVLARHFPPEPEDRNELPNRVVED
jgi:uncharacterized membrane protein